MMYSSLSVWFAFVTGMFFATFGCMSNLIEVKVLCMLLMLVLFVCIIAFGGK